MNTVDVIYFSPTGSTRRVAFEIAKGWGGTPNIIDLTQSHNRIQKTILSGDAAVIAVPVYEDHVPELLNDYFAHLSANGQPALIAVVYGNIGYGHALHELLSKTKETGLRVVGAGAFIAEHSFSTRKHPVAPGRPNADDLKQAYALGEQAGIYIDSTQKTDVCLPKAELTLMSVLPRNSAQLLTKPPVMDRDVCTDCGACTSVCPVNAIDYRTRNINTKKCIRCFACVKRCGPAARKIKYRIPLASKILYAQGKIQKNNFIVMGELR